MKKSSILAVFLVVLCAFSVVEIVISAGTDSPVWSPPMQIVTAPPDLADPTISYDSSSKLWVLFTTEGPGSTRQLSYITSTDLGVTWSSPHPFPPALVPEGPHYVADSCFFEDSHGRLWAAWGRWTGSSQEDIYFSTSDDLGASWSNSRLLVSYPDVDGSPCFVEVGTEVWLVFSSWGISYNWNIYCIKTSDGGSTWSLPQGIVVDSFRHDGCSVLKDSTGKVWIVYTNLISPYDPHTSDLWCVMTADNGQTWSLPSQITSFPSEEAQPTIVEYSGMFYVFYFDRYSTDILYVASEDGGSTWSTTPGRITDPTVDQHYLYATVMKGRIFVVWQSRMGGNMDIWLTKNMLAPAIGILSPQAITYTTSTVPLTFTVDEPTSWVGYSLDNQPNVTISGNTTLNVEDGSHQIVAYANNTLGDMGSSEIVSFAVDTTFHDIAVSSITLSKTVLGQGYSVNITAMVNNLGNYTETSNISFYANTTLIGKSTDFTLPSGGSTKIVFTWNSAGFSKGVYGISACAEPVPKEKDLSNNNFTDGTMRVTIPGDVNGDFKVNCGDLAMLLCSYGANLGSVRCNPNCDINSDGKINCMDLAILLCHYGQHYP